MKYLVCLVEEPSAKEMLKSPLPLLLPDSGSRSIAHYLKTDGSNLSHSFNVLLDGIRKKIL
ncbi:MAG: hypothetical protein HQK72_17405 [Desulfamplus sp.]|nr:hypothetical protein [Desulfamplus sp.]